MKLSKNSLLFVGTLALSLLLGSSPAFAAPTIFNSISDGEWRGDPAPLPWAIVSGGGDHSFPVAGDTANLAGHTVSLSQDESVAFLNVFGDLLSFNGGRLTVTGGGSWSRGAMTNGTLENLGLPFALTPAAVLTLSANFQNRGRVNHTGSAQFVINPGAALENLSGGVLDLQADASILAGSGAGPSPQIANLGVLMKTGSGVSTLGEGCFLDNAGTMEVRAGTLRIDAGIDQFFNGLLGGGTWKVYTNATLDCGFGSIRTNAASIILDGSNATFPNTSGLARNQGHFSLLNGAMFISSGALENAGILEVGNGSLLALLGNLTQTAGGQISGDGSVEAFFVNDGLVNPGRPVGVLTVGQDFVQTASGQVTIEIGGTNAGTQYDQLNVRNTAVFEGALQITLLNGFLPRPGDQFRIVNYNSHTGAFATIQGADLGPDLILFPSYQNDGLTLVAMPPQITFTAPVRTPDDFSFAFQTYAGLTYTVEYTDTLTPPDWQWLDQFVGDGSMVVIIDGFLYEPQRFYHVLVK